MQKLNKKTITKPVGALSVRNTHEKDPIAPSKNHRGITLIALIITIIVMIILVGVTVNVALNGGLFDAAQKAANSTQIEVDKETLQAAALGSLGENAEVDFTKLDTNLPDGFEGSNGTYTKDGNTYKVDQYGNVTYKEPSTGDLLLLEKYFLGENGEGKNLMSLVNNDGLFIDDPDTISDASTSITFLDLSLNGDFSDLGQIGYFKYNNKAYKLEFDIITFETKEVELIYEPQGREGEIVKYDGDNDGAEEDWMILYDNGDNKEIISLDTMGSLTLGANDEQAQGETDLEKAIYSYNNAITRLNNYCASLITNENKISVRSAGSNPNDPLNENNTLYKSENLRIWMDGEYNELGKSEDENYIQDSIRLSFFNCDDYIVEGYWLASRIIDEDSNSNEVSFEIANIYYSSARKTIFL